MSLLGENVGVGGLNKIRKTFKVYIRYTYTMQQTTMRVSKKLLEALSKLKINDRETYEEVIWDLIDPYLELSKEVKDSLQEAEKDFERGETTSFEDLKKKHGF